MMKRNKLLGLIIGAVLIVGLGVWLLLRSDGAAKSSDQQTQAGGGDNWDPRQVKAHRGSARPELTREAKATITGTVRDREGQGVAGAQVCAWASTRDLEGLPPGKPRCTKSEADGHYRLEGLLPVRMVVNAEARGYLPQRWFGRHETYREEQILLRAGQVREGVDFVLRPGGVELEGIVRDISGGVIEGAFVWARTSGFDESGRSATQTDAEGRFSLWMAPGRLVVYAEAQGYAPGDRYTAAPGATVEVVLTPESVINGRVVLAGTQEPVAGVFVEAEGEAFFSDGQGRARSDDAGNFRIDRLQPGIYTVGARGDELFGEASELVHLGLAETADGVVIELHPAFMVTGRVVLAAAGIEPRPCPQGFVRLHDRADKRNSRSGRVGPGGEVEVRNLLPGTYEVEVDCDGTVPELEYPDVEITNTSASGLVWEVHEGLAIRGEIIDARGQPVEGVQVFADMKIDADDPRKQMTRSISEPTLEDGQFAAVGLLPGTYEVKMFAFDRARDVEPITVELTPGADVNDVRIQLPSDGSLAGIVRDADGKPVAGVQLRATALEQRSGAVGISDDEGRFVIEHLPIGEIRLIAMDGMSQLKAPGTTDDDEQGLIARVTANETTEVELIIESRKATIRGRVLDEHGSPVADAFVSHQRMSDSAAAAKGAGKHSLRWQFDDRPVLTNTDGTFVIEGLAEDANYVIGAFRKGGGEAVQDGVQAGESVELTITATGEIAGTLVVANTNTAPERVKLTVRNEAEALTRNDELFRSGGQFRMKELPPGTYTLIADSPSGAARIEGIELAAGESKQDLVVTLSPRVTVRGRLIDIDTRQPVPGMSVSVGARGTSMGFRQEKGGDAPHISDAEGRFEVANALTGKVMLAVTPRSFNDATPYSWLWMSHQIPAGEGVVDIGDIELVADRVERGDKPGDIGFEIKQPEIGAEPEDFVPTIAVIRPGGPAAGTALAVGDPIETVDGHDVRGNNGSRFGRLTKVEPGASFELGLVGGETVTITAGPPIE